MLNHVRSCFIIAILLLAVPASYAQVTTGTPPFGDMSGSPDKVDLGNLNVHLTFPTFHKPGRGIPFSFDFGNDSALWVPVVSNGMTFWEPKSTFGWVGSGTNIGTLGATIISGSGFFEYCGFTYFDGFGTSHVFPGCAVVDSSGDFPLTTATIDGSGYSLKADGCGILQNNVCFLVFSLTSVEGNSIVPQNATPVIGSSGASSGSIIDRNGNQITAHTDGTFTDTLGTTVLTNTGGFPANPNNVNPPPAPSPFDMTYTSPAGTPAAAKLTYKLYSVRTNFGCSGIVEFGASTPYSNYFPDRITLADGQFYQFQYESTPGFSASITGRLSSVTLPTGGKITYSYTGSNNGIICSDGSTSGLTRATPDGSWTYTRVQGAGAASTNTITDPQGNQTVIDFQGIYETQKNVFQGSSGSGTLLQQTNTCYNGSASPCTGTAITLPITNKTVITQLGVNGRQSKKVTLFDSTFGVPTEVDDFDFGNGAPGALLKKTLTVYASLGNIHNSPKTITIQNSSGALASQTTYNYDETAVAATTGTPQLVNIGTAVRGNVTSVQSLTQGTTTLTSRFTYYDTGNLQTATDINGAQTTYLFGAGSCGNSFPTTINEAANLSRTMTWNCVGGVQTSTTDENSQKTTIAYTDSFLWRPSSTTDPANNTTSYIYQGATSTEAILPVNSGQSSADVLETVDGLGRKLLHQTRQAPGSANFDSVETDYDALGRSRRLTLAYSGTAGQTNSTAPAKLTSYDALGRVVTVTDSAGGSISYQHTSNDVLVTAGPAPSNESAKVRQMEYDALGRLTSVCEVTTLGNGGPCGQTVAQTGFWTKYTYDALGNVTSVIQNAQAAAAQQQTRSFTYDGLSRVTSETNPESGKTTYTYDTDTTCGTSSGDLVKRQDAVGNTACYTYDLQHRQTSTAFTGPYAANTPNKYFVYDAATIATTPTATAMLNAKGLLAEAYTATCQTCAKITDEGFSYSPRLGEVNDIYQSTSHSGGYFHLHQTYWPTGASSQLSGNLGVPALSYGVDGEGRLNSASTAAQNLVSGITYNVASQPTQLNLGTGDTDSFGYDPNTARMTQYKFNVGAQSVVGNLTWNANATLQQLAIADPFNAANNQTCAYRYDDLTRVSTVQCAPPGDSFPDSWIQFFGYDAFGNLNKSGSTLFVPTYTDANGHTDNRFASIPGCTISYDANGDVLNDCLHTYTWNAEGRPVTIDGITLTFDAFSRMVEQNRSGTLSQIAYAPTGEKFALMNGQTLQKAYIPLPGPSAAVYTNGGFKYYRHKDWLGSSRLASTTTPAATAGMGSSTVFGSEQSLITTPAQPGRGSGTVNGSEQSATGPATTGTATVTINGTEQSFTICDPRCPNCGCRRTVFDRGTVTITVNGLSKSVSYASASTGASLATSLASAFNGDSTSPVSASSNGSTVTLTSKVTGTASNYAISATSSTVDPADFGVPSFNPAASGATLTGGANSTQIFDTGTVSISVQGCQASVSYGQSSTTASVASALVNAINAEPASCALVVASLSGSTVNLLPSQGATGPDTNYQLTTTSTSNQPSSFSKPSFAITLSGATMTGGANAIKLFDTGTASITVNGVQTTVNYGQNDTNLTVASSLASAINANATVPAKAAAGGTVIVLTAKTAGANTNYSVSASSATGQPTKFTHPSFTVSVSGAALTGGSASATTMYSSTAYSPFGESYAQVGTADLSFTGLNQDTSPGLYDAEAREYSLQGRWPSPDPGGISSMHIEDPQTLNRYAYSRNNPLSLVDPSGNDPCDFDPSCGGDFGGGFGGFGDPIWGEQWPIYTGPPLDPSLIIFNYDDCVVNGPDAQTPVTCRQGDSITVTADPLPPPDTSDHWWRDFFKDLFSLDSFGQAQQDAWDRGYYSCIGNKLIPFKGLAAAAGAKAAEEAATHAAEHGSSKLAGAYYHFTDGRFTAWGKSSKVLVPELAESITKVAKVVNVAGWVVTDVELAHAIHTCSERLGGGGGVTGGGGPE